ncbi:MAG TPA: hypothetical protein VMR95_03935 [Candidatus Binatia bacterium]|nr:hypothetical protein [Candidatus Binatia bacterium]
MDQRLKGLTKWLSGKKLIIALFIVGLALFTVSVSNSVIYKEFNSDDVAWQVILKDLSVQHIHSSHKVFLPADDFVIKFPIYILIDHWLYGTRRALDIESIGLAATGYVLFFWSAYWLLKRFTKNKKNAFGLSMTPILWVSCLSIFFYTMFSGPSIRNIEIGLDFFFLALLLSQYFLVDKAKWAKKSIYFKVLLSVILIAALGFYLYSDPYSEYVFFGPLFLLVGIRYLWRSRQNSYLYLLIVLLASFVSIVLWRKLLYHLGFESANPPGTIAPIKALPASLSLTWHGIIDTFNVDFTGWPIVNSITKLIDLAFLIGVILLHFNRGVVRSLRNNLLHQVLILQVLVAIGLFAFSTNSVGVDISFTHYFVILPFCMALIGALAVASREKSRFTNRLILVGLSLLVVVSIGQNYVLYIDRDSDASNSYSMPVPLQSNDIGPPNYHNNENKLIAKVAVANGLTKGYADYWSGAINTYFTHGKVQFLQVWCSAKNQITPYYQLLDSKSLLLPAKSTFFLYNDTAAFSSSDAWCGSPPHLLSQFGSPVKIIPVTTGISFYVYNYDIISKMHLVVPTQ